MLLIFGVLLISRGAPQVMNSGVMLFLHFFVSPHVKWFNHRLPVQDMFVERAHFVRLNCHWVRTQAGKFLLGLLPQWQTAKTTAMLYLELPLQSAFLTWHHHIVTGCCWQWDYAVWEARLEISWKVVSSWGVALQAERLFEASACSWGVALQAECLFEAYT